MKVRVRARCRTGVLALTIAASVVAAIPDLTSGRALVDVQLPGLPTPPSVGVPGTRPTVPSALSGPAAGGYAAASPTYTPPLHGTGPHGQGTVAEVGTGESSSGGGPVSGNPIGGSNQIVAGRSRGDQGSNGDYHGHITMAALFGTELLGVDSTPSGSRTTGSLAILKSITDPLNSQVLAALCSGSGGQVCLQVLTADSTTTSTGSTNHFAVANAALGGATGVHATAAESDGNIAQTSSCQTAHGHSRVAGVTAGGTTVANVAESTSDSQACRGGSPSSSSSSQVVNLLGNGLPVPAAGCGTGAPNTTFSLSPLLTIVCNASDLNGGQTSVPYNVREALTTFALQTGTTSVLKATTGAAETHAVAPAAPSNPGNPGTPGSPGTPPGTPTIPGTNSTESNFGEGGETASSNSELAAAPEGEAGTGALPHTGTDLVLLALAGLAALGSGLAIRRLAAEQRTA